MENLSIPILAFLLDTIIGDPKIKWHPVALIGNVIGFYETIFYNKADSGTAKIIYGLCTVLFTFATVLAVGFLLITLANTIHYWVGFAMKIIILYITISPRALASAGDELASLLKTNNITEAREKLGWIVGRDTKELDESEITRATIETVAENTVDGILAPYFFYAILGPMGALFYRTANTLDSMLGYKNDRYIYFGRVAAKLDDLLTYIPARIGSLLFIGAAFLLRFDYKSAYKVGRRDAKKHPSPNGGYAEAPVAGALHIRLGGYNKYGDITTFREYMGEAIEPMRGIHIRRTIGLMYISTLEMVGLVTLVLYLTK